MATQLQMPLSDALSKEQELSNRLHAMETRIFEKSFQEEMELDTLRTESLCFPQKVFESAFNEQYQCTDYIEC